MFCQQCGESFQLGSRFCPKCGTPVYTAVPERDQTRSSVNVEITEAAAIWNPNAASNWSIIFTPAFGSYLHALNWRALGEEERAKSSITWFYASLGMLAVYILMGLIIQDGKAAHDAVRGLGLLYLIIWYFSAGRSQAKYVKSRYGAKYSRRSWGKPLLIALAAFVVYFLAAMIIGFLFGMTR